MSPHAMKSGFEDSSDDGNESTVQQNSATPNGPDEDRGRHRLISPRKEQSYLGGAFPSDYLTECKDDVPVMLNILQLTETYIYTHSQASGRRPPPGPRDSASYDGEDATPVATEARPLSFQASGPGKVVNHSSARSSVFFEDIDNSEPNSAAVVATIEATNEAIKDIHTQTMQALLRNEETLQASVGRICFAPDTAETRSSGKNRVSIAPPPLDMNNSSTWVPENIVRTPYPFLFRKALGRPSPLRTSASIDRGRESILALSIRRHEGTSHARRFTRMTIPANLDAASKLGAASPGAKEKHFDTLDFDDAHFFHKLRDTYHSLAGPFRFFSARTLQCIEVSHSACASDGYTNIYDVAGVGRCSHESPRSPRFLASRGLTDSFSTAEIMKYYQHPDLGKARYAWVHWAHHISILPAHLRSPAPAPPADSPAARLSSKVSKEKDVETGGDQCAAGLEFVEGWCAWRILLAIVAVGVCATAAALCWILLGVDLARFPSGYRDAGQRVEGGSTLR